MKFFLITLLFLNCIKVNANLTAETVILKKNYPQNSSNLDLGISHLSLGLYSSIVIGSRCAEALGAFIMYKNSRGNEALRFTAMLPVLYASGFLAVDGYKKIRKILAHK